VTIGAIVSEFGLRLIANLLEVAPSLVLAYAITGLASEFVPAASLAWLGKGSSFVRALKGMAIAAPMPLCSCSAVPLFQRLSAVPGGGVAAFAFLLAGPELGLDSVLISIPLLGAPMTALRTAAAVLVAVVVALILGRAVGDAAPVPTGRRAMPVTTPIAPPVRERMRRAFHFGFEESLGHTLLWILAGLLVAALVAPTPAAATVASWPTPLQILALAALGMPTYVCASAATPLVATLLASGVSPGAGIAFLIAGPATNLTTFALVARCYGRPAARLFTASVLLTVVGVAWAADSAARRLDVEAPLASSAVVESASVWQLVAVALLGIALSRLIIRRGWRHFVAELRAPFATVPHADAPRL